ncbi:MAG: hypothetical protein LBT47_06280 [Deltaproteobacteria bacterium]|jgi:hypothetical protein|nr:hypothetical protein [Deltaproteobacteria bacterium]
MPVLTYNQAKVYGGCILFIILIYILTIVTTDQSLELNSRLALGFVQGHTYIAEVPELELFSDPYDPSANYKFRKDKKYFFHDTSYYNGKIYLYYGPVPALTFFLPFQGFGLYPRDCTAVLTFVIGAFLFQALLFLRLTARADCDDLNSQNPGAWFSLIGLFVLGLNPSTLVLFRKPQVYEVAMAASLFFISGALWFLTIRWLFSKNNWLLFLTSLFLILGVGSRITVIIPSAIFFLAATYLLLKEKAKIGPYLLLFLPFAFGGILLLLYNYARFDSFFEFGINYIISDFHPLRVVAGFPEGSRLSNFFVLINEYLFNFGEFTSFIPFFYPTKNITPNLIVYEVSIFGILSCFPVKWSLILLPYFYNYWKKIGQKMLSHLSLILVVSAILILGALAKVPLVTPRYVVNINYFLTLASLLIWGSLLSRLWFQNVNQNYFDKQKYIMPLFVISSLTSIYFSLCNYYYAAILLFVDKG